MRGLYWFRSDLRCSDNLALTKAIQQSDLLIAVFLLTPETWKSHGISSAKVQFLLENLCVLTTKLAKQGIPLLIRDAGTFANCASVIENLCETYEIELLYFNHEYPLDECNRDAAVIKRLSDRVTFHRYHEQLVLQPGSVMSKQGKPLQVFTPFKQEWLAKAECSQSWHCSPRSRKKFEFLIPPDPVPTEVKGFEARSIMLNYAGGEKAAELQLKAFCHEKLFDYQKNRDMPSLEGTSRLSPYLTQGVISPRQCIVAAMKAGDIKELSGINLLDGVSVWISELIWREFYYHLIYFYPDLSRGKPFKLKTDNIPWRYDTELFEAWKNGMTGFPLVDAAMRQLLQTGWMHNRLRMVTAMFLTKILLIDWRWGEKHFMAHLIDGDFASNNGGWQWCASTGTDAVPYFRIFNPTTQSERFDPNGDFIRQYCPELSHLNYKTIHDPYARGVKPGTLDYPQPIVDYAVMRKLTLDLFKAI